MEEENTDSKELTISCKDNTLQNMHHYISVYFCSVHIYLKQYVNNSGVLLTMVIH